MIFINGKFLAQKLTGVQRTSLEILKSIDFLCETYNLNITLLAPKDAINIKLENIKVVRTNFKSSFFWEQALLPILTINRLLINFSGSAPLLKYGQIITIHDAVLYDQPFAYSKLFIIWYRLLFYIQGHFSKLVMTVSQFSKERLIYYLPHIKNKILVINNGYEHVYKLNQDLSIIEELNLKNKSFFLTVGSRNPNKNLQFVENLSRKFSEQTFVLVTNYNTNIFASNKLKNGNNLIYATDISDEKLIALYSKADAVLCPSSYEGFGITLIESLALETNVIASDIPAHVEVGGNKPIYFVNNKYDDFEKKFQKYLNNQLSINNFDDNWKKYSWKKAASLIINFLKNE